MIVGLPTLAEKVAALQASIQGARQAYRAAEDPATRAVLKDNAEAMKRQLGALVPAQGSLL